MKEYYSAVKVTENVYWVGAIDWNLRSFHGYETRRGSTYNAFLVIDEKITLIDTVKAPFYDELMTRIKSVIDPAQIDYIVSNHSEMDHSGALPKVIDAVKPEKVFASMMGERALKAQLGDDLDISIVKTGDSINIGKMNLSFVETRMLHWPDSMITYLDGDKVIFSQDAFGMHLAGSQLFYDDYPEQTLYEEGSKYFANILLPYSCRVTDLLNKLPELNLDVDIIAPDHGPLWHGDGIDWVIEQYKNWSNQEFKKRALVFYSTMWSSTEKLARSLADGLSSQGIPVEVANVEITDRSDIITKITESGLVATGVSTINNEMYPEMADIMTYVRGLKPQNHIGFAFGSYGWSGEGAKQVHEDFTKQGFEMPLEPYCVKYVPTSEELIEIYNIGVELGQKMLEKLQ